MHRKLGDGMTPRLRYSCCNSGTLAVISSSDKPCYPPNAPLTPKPPLAYICQTSMEPELGIHSSVIGPEEANRSGNCNRQTVGAKSSSIRQHTVVRQPTSDNVHTEQPFLFVFNATFVDRIMTTSPWFRSLGVVCYCFPKS